MDTLEIRSFQHQEVRSSIEGKVMIFGSFSVAIVLLVVGELLQVERATARISCNACGPECKNACGTQMFRACCFNYNRKRSLGSLRFGPGESDSTSASGDDETNDGTDSFGRSSGTSNRFYSVDAILRFMNDPKNEGSATSRQSRL